MLIGIGATVYGGIAAALKYLLKSTFTRADTGAIANGTVLNSAALGVENGSLTVVDTDAGTVEVLGNVLKITNTAGVVTGIYGASVGRSIGVTLLSSFTINTAGSSTHLGFNSSASIDVATYRQGTFRMEVGSTVYYGFGEYVAVSNSPLAVSTEYQMALVIGGYDVNGVPYKIGDTKSNFTYGMTLMIKGGAYTNWTLFWKSTAGNAATLYPVSSGWTYVNTLDNFRIPDKDLSAVLQPVVLDTFTDANGTALTAHTSDVGAGAWTNLVGTFDIQSNVANCTSVGATAYGGSTAVAVKNCGISDGVLEVVNPSTGNDRLLVFRATDKDNMWFATVWLGNMKLSEITAGVHTYRASSTPTMTAGGKITVILDGQNISAFYNGANKIGYTSSVRQTVATHGFGAWGTTMTIDNFACFPRTSATYETEFGAV